MRRPSEHRFSERSEGDLLVQEFSVLFQQRRFMQMRLQRIVGSQITAVESVKKVAEPGMRRRLQSLQYRMQQQLAEIVDAIRDQRRDTQIVSPCLRILLWQAGQVNAGEVEEGGFVVGAEIGVGLVVGGVCAVEGGVDFGFDGVEGVKGGFGGVEVFAGPGEGVQAEFDFGGGDEGVDVGVLGGGLVDFLGEVG